MIAFGTGTSVEGQVQALKGGLCIDFSLMSQFLEINEADLDCVVEFGVTRKQLNQVLRDKGLFFPVALGANATLGGTCTCEHGIGLSKRAYLIAERDHTAVDLMARIKHAMDPLNLLNPGKLFFQYTHLPGLITQPD